MSSTLNNTTFTGESIFNGTMRLPSNINGEIGATNLAQRVLQQFLLPLQDFVVHNAIQSGLPNPSAADDLGLYGATYATNAPQILTYDVKSAGAVTLYARFPNLIVPACYDTGETIELFIHTGMEGALADTTATLDVEVLVNDGEGGYSGADRYVGAALDVNSLTWASKQFDLGTGLTPGDHLDIRLTLAVNDAAGGSSVQAGISRVTLRCDTR